MTPFGRGGKILAQKALARSHCRGLAPEGGVFRAGGRFLLPLREAWNSPVYRPD